MAAELKAVNNVGTVQATIATGKYESLNLHRGRNGDERLVGTLPTGEISASDLALFSHEVQLWLDGSLHWWGRPARIVAENSPGSDRLTFECDGLASYLGDVFVGQIPKPRHGTSPHEDASAGGAAPTSWTNSGATDVSVVTNNAEIGTKSIQVNHNVTGDDAYIYQRFTVTSALDRVPFQASAIVWIADDDGGAPAWGGPALNNRGLVILRRATGGGAYLSDFQIARITNETPRNQRVRLQTGSLLPLEGQDIEIRLYAPNAWVVWRFMGLFDGRWVEIDREDKSVAFTRLVAHAQDTAIGKEDYNLDVDVTSLGITASLRWPWWRHDNILEQLRILASDLEWEVVYSGAAGSMVRQIKVRDEVGTDRTATTLDKTDTVGWSYGHEIGDSANHIIRMGEGDGIARDEGYAEDNAALSGHVREAITFAPIGEPLGQLNRSAENDLAKVKDIVRALRYRITGATAKQTRPGDSYTINHSHGWATYSGTARAATVDYDVVADVAEVVFNP